MKFHQKRVSLKQKLGGKGLINRLINKIPFEVHIPNYNYCGPGTKLEKRLARGDSGINPLDSACKEHDIFYSKHTNIEDRHKADLILQQKADLRTQASDASLLEKVAAHMVKRSMQVKRAVGAGVRRKRGAGCRKRKNIKKGGYLLPMIATALTAFKTYKDFKNAKKAMEVQKQHNENMERIAKGKGLYLKPYRGGGGKKKRRKNKKHFL